MINARDGGINGVKLTFEECETGYATDRGVECYERLKSRPGVTLFDPQSTGITFALTEKAPADKIPLMTLGYGLSVAQDGMAFKWNFPFMGSYWTGADILIQHMGKAWAAGQAQGQEDRAGLPRQPVRQGTHPAAAGARQDARL
jgi:branched-chain amino acid transport system substrate-binding protein